MATKKNLKQEIISLLKTNLLASDISKRLGCSKAIITYYKRKEGIEVKPRSSPNHNWSAIQKDYDNGMTTGELYQKYGVVSQTLSNAKRRGDFTPRSMSHAAKCRIDKHGPNRHTKESKEKLRQHMLARLKDGTFPTLGKSNRLIGKPSYPEIWFNQVIKNEFDDKNVILELPFGIYSLDFAWPHLKKCIEIDGEQHYADQTAIDRDRRKDEYIKDQGWQVLRLRWKLVFKDTKAAIQAAKDFIAR